MGASMGHEIAQGGPPAWPRPVRARTVVRRGGKTPSVPGSAWTALAVRTPPPRAFRGCAFRVGAGPEGKALKPGAPIAAA